MLNFVIDKYHITIANIDPNVPGAKGMKPMPMIETKYLANVFIS